MCDGRDDVLWTGGGVKNIVTIDTDRHGKFPQAHAAALFKGH